MCTYTFVGDVNETKSLYPAVYSITAELDSCGKLCRYERSGQYDRRRKNKDDKQSVASISKIMTAVIAIEHGKLDEAFTVDEEINKAYGSSVYLKQGQTVTLRDLLYALMLRSGNDAAVEIAKHVSGSQEAFVEAMNQKAAEIGMSNTTFSNPSGLDEEDGGNISTANDMAILMSYAMKNKEFRTITGSKYYTTDWNMRWKNKNRLLFDYPFTIGGKTGFTKKQDGHW